MRRLLACALVLALSACTAGEARRAQQREHLTRRIIDDAVAYNEAYSAAISGQILLNILRAYNRQPRQYMAMSGFANSKQDSRDTALGVSDLPLGRLGEEWGNGALSVAEARRLEPEYNVEPFGAEAYANIALRPTSQTVLRRYWETGWNREMLLLLMADRMEVGSIDGAAARVLYNSAGTIAGNCEGPPQMDGCAFVREVRALAPQTARLAQLAPTAPRAGGCAPMAVYEVAETSVADARRRGRARAVAPNAEGVCPTYIIVGAARYVLHLRSLDDMVYYVGELLRRDAAAPHPAPTDVLEARLAIAAPGAPQAAAPLFRVVPATPETERDYAASVRYGGRRFSAGAPANLFCYRPGDRAACAGAAAADRSGTVLEFLVAILAYNQSEAAVSAPQGAVVTTR